MEDSIYLVKNGEKLERIKKCPYDSEDLLQGLIENYPDLLAGDQINPEAPIRWIVIKREAGVPDNEINNNRWSVDHLLLDQNAVPTFVETKRSSDTRIRREIVGQMLDYAANSQKYWPVDHIRALTINKYSGEETADSAILELLEINQDQDIDNSQIIESYWSKVSDNLKSGNVRLLFVADQIPAELRRVIEFLNEHMLKVEVLGVELPQFRGLNFQALVPRLIGQTELTRQSKEITKSSSRKTTKQEFLLKIPEEIQTFFTDLFAEAENHNMQIYWGSKGFSLRAKSESGKWMSLFYGFPPGASDRPDACIQAYAGYIENPAAQQDFKERFLSIKNTVPGGEYTVNLEFNSENIDSARKMVKLLWEIKDHYLNDPTP